MDEHPKHSLFLREFSKSQTRLSTFILMVVHNSQDADEIFQETASLLWEQFDKFESGTNFGAWAVSIAKYKIMEYLKQNKRKRDLFRPELYRELSVLAEPASSDTDHRTRALQSCFYKLDCSCRSLLSLRYQKNLPIEKIAQKKGVSTGAMYRKISKIFNLLRRCIERTLVQWQ